MEHRIYTAAEARALLDGTTPGPWGVWEGYLEVHARVVSQGRGTIRAEGGEVCKIDEYRHNPTDRNPRGECDCEEDDCPECFSGPHRDIALIAAAPDLAASVEHHAARADALAADLQRVTMEMHAARHLAEESQRARVKQSLELAEARAEVVRLNARVADLESSLRDHAEVCSFCGRGGSWCCVDRSRSAADALRSLSAKDGAP